MTAKEILAVARTLLSKPGGWGQGKSWDARMTTFCLWGALQAAAGREGRENGELMRVVSILESCAGAGTFVGCMSIIRWNDMEGRTQADVLDLMDTASLRMWNYVPPEPMPRASP